MLFFHGTRLNASIEAADLLAGNGMNVTIADARFAKPLDTDLIDDLAGTHGSLLIVEEGSRWIFRPRNDISCQSGASDGLLKVRAYLPDNLLTMIVKVASWPSPALMLMVFIRLHGNCCFGRIKS